MKGTLPGMVALCLAGCPVGDDGDVACNLAAFDDALVIAFERESWDPGEHVFAVQRNAEGSACLLEVEAGAQVFSTTRCIASTSTDGRTVFQGAPVEVVDRRVVFEFPTHPREVEVTVTHDGAEVFRRPLTPRYGRDEPNGPGCGFRFTAMEVVRVP